MADPEHDTSAVHRPVWELAGKMYELVLRAGTDGMAFPHIAEALAMLNGLLLACAYGPDGAGVETAMQQISQASIEHAGEFHARLPSMPATHH